MGRTLCKEEGQKLEYAHMVGRFSSCAVGLHVHPPSCSFFCFSSHLSSPTTFYRQKSMTSRRPSRRFRYCDASSRVTVTSFPGHTTKTGKDRSQGLSSFDLVLRTKAVKPSLAKTRVICNLQF